MEGREIYLADSVARFALAFGHPISDQRINTEGSDASEGFEMRFDIVRGRGAAAQSSGAPEGTMVACLVVARALQRRACAPGSQPGRAPTHSQGRGWRGVMVRVLSGVLILYA